MLDATLVLVEVQDGGRYRAGRRIYGHIYQGGRGVGVPGSLLPPSPTVKRVPEITPGYIPPERYTLR